uniref:BTB domain-containing protein n=1 Tax=Denticeps clupeoides TaxID=299321 RepID=A0AAY4BTH9_9TELE
KRRGPTRLQQIKVEESVFAVDKALLLEGSEYFRALFRSGMKECRQQEIRVGGLSSGGFLLALSVLNGARPVLNADEIVAAIECAAFLQVERLVQHLIDSVNSDNCLLMYHTAGTYGLPELFRRAALFIRDMHRDLEDGLASLPKQLVDYVESLLPSSYVMVGTHSPSDELLRDPVRTVCYLDEDEQDWRVLTHLPVDVSTTMAGVAVLDNKLYIVGGVRDMRKNVVDSGFCYDPVMDAWSTFPSPRQLRYNLTLVGIDDRLYALGGVHERKPLSSVEALRVSTNTWSFAADLPRAATAVPCAKAMSRVFICLWKCKDTTELYEYVPLRDQWAFISSLTRPRSYGHFMVSHRDNLYIVRNGPDDDFLRCMMDCYNLTTNQWTALPGQYEALFTTAIRGDSAFTLNRNMTLEYAIGDLQWKTRRRMNGFPRIGSMWTFLLRFPKRRNEPPGNTAIMTNTELSVGV